MYMAYSCRYTSIKLNKNKRDDEEIENNKEKEQKMREETAEKTRKEQPQKQLRGESLCKPA